MKKRKAKTKVVVHKPRVTKPRATQASLDGNWITVKRDEGFFIFCQFGPYSTKAKADQHAAMLNTMEKVAPPEAQDDMGLFS